MVRSGSACACHACALGLEMRAVNVGQTCLGMHTAVCAASGTGHAHTVGTVLLPFAFILLERPIMHCQIRSGVE